jgi:dTDP-4-amino-4,6-dideoxygalactose transaminase
MPSFTFAATAIAAERCGFQPYLVDVDPATWTLDPATLAGHAVLDKAGVVLVVAPFGRPVSQAPWIEFQDRTGIAVVVDAAASFSCISQAPARFLGPIPTVLSFHATKSFGIGEGGCVISTRQGLYERTVAALNFGFVVNRNSSVPSLNGRLSEYHAAVGLAELDSWAAKCVDLNDVARNYRNAFIAAGLSDGFYTLPLVDGNYALYLCRCDAEAASVQSSLKDAHVDFRFWYDKGLHHHRHFANVSRDDLPISELLGRRLIGLPTAPDLRDVAIKRVADAVAAGVAASQRVITTA